ncbi:MAG: type II secretion system protein [Fimbriimonas sp.]|nr:type II secretion system protein [Fimbriimonas sp.]
MGWNPEWRGLPDRRARREWARQPDLKKVTNRGFTLLEVLVVTTIISLLAAVLFPVLGNAKAAAKETASISSFKQINLALPMYSSDYDDLVANVYTGSYRDINGTWVGLVQPYTRNFDIFWDPTRNRPTPDQDGLWRNPAYSSYGYAQSWIVPTGINLTGYAFAYNGTGCSNPWASVWGPRSLSSIDGISQRMATTPTTFGIYGWMNFRSVQASWPYFGAHQEQSRFTWENLVYETSYTHAGAKIPIGYGDGHAGKIGLASFVDHFKYPTIADYCSQMDARNLWPLWGKSWSPN